GEKRAKNIKDAKLQPHLSVHLSNKHSYAQLFDYSYSKTLVTCSTFEEVEVKGDHPRENSNKKCKLVQYLQLG
ncbi:unnamed protein product, partial [Sphacelaria rigidula]